jgi:hypothetical protein
MKAPDRKKRLGLICFRIHQHKVASLLGALILTRSHVPLQALWRNKPPPIRFSGMLLFSNPLKNGGVQPFFSSFPLLQLHMLDYFSSFIEKVHHITTPLSLRQCNTHFGAFSNAQLIKNQRRQLKALKSPLCFEQRLPRPWRLG